MKLNSMIELSSIIYVQGEYKDQGRIRELPNLSKNHLLTDFTKDPLVPLSLAYIYRIYSFEDLLTN